MKIPDPLKKAITQMPENEKDKLLLRLIAKDDLLVEKLQHQLLEDASDTHARQAEIEKIIHELAAYKYYDTPGWLMMSMRDVNGAISKHVKITKDKNGEIKLTLLLVNEVFRKQKNLLDKMAFRAENFAEYVVKKADFVLKKLEKIHPDYYVEFEDDINEMLTYLHNYAPCKIVMKAIPLPQRWIV